MEVLLVLALSMIVAMGFNYAQPKIFAMPSLAKYQTSYAGKTFFTGAVIFLAILAAGYLFKAVGEGVTVTPKIL
jgi:hypothetical protein